MFKFVSPTQNLLYICSFFPKKVFHQITQNYLHLHKKNISEVNLNSRTFCFSSTLFNQDDKGNSSCFEAVCKGNKELEHKLKVLNLEMEVMRQEGRLVPEDHLMGKKHWEELLNLGTISSRRRYLEYLFKLFKAQENRQIKREQKRIERGEKPPKNENETFEEFVSQYDLQHNTIFMRIYDTTINNFYNNRLVQAMLFGQKLVVDCGYHPNMTSRENSNCAKQLMLLFAENRAHDDPFDLHFCNSDPDSSLMKILQKNIATLHEPSFPLHIHETSYLDIFPKDSLVYLTPHCKEEIDQYDHDAVYIIGGIVDKTNQEPLSLAKAKKEGLKMAKLPLDRYLSWGSGSGKSLTINQVISILLDIKTAGDWKYALRHVPKRKIIDPTSFTNLERPTSNSRFRSTPNWRPSANSGQAKINKDRVFKVRSILYDE